MRRRRHKKLLVILLILLLMLVITICSIVLKQYKNEYDQADSEYSELASEYASNIERAGIIVSDDSPVNFSNTNESISDTNVELVDFASLTIINPDVVAWITIPSCGINYPVLQGDDNNQYLRATYSGEANSAGSIFIDSNNSADFSDYNTFIYGHNMKNGSMFGMLKTIRDNPSLISDDPYVYIFTPDGKIYKYLIFSVRTVSADSSVYHLVSSASSYDEFVEDCLCNSIYSSDIDIDFSARSPLITLSTCSGSDNDRFLVHCVLLATY